MMQATPVLAVGLMSGTSCDGVDAALLTTDGLDHIGFGPSLTLPYDDGFRTRLRSVLGGGGPVPAVERELTEIHAAAVAALLSRAAVAPDRVAVVGFHGQTILHEPVRGRTWQIGDGELLARLTGIDVVNDFRGNDMAHGGQGAPFVPLFHAALAVARERPVAFLNIGGVANVTYVGPADSSAGPAGGDLIAFDTGPGNALLDDWALRHTGQPVDKDGRLARGGTADLVLLAQLLSHPFFRKKPPKSLDRDAFDPHVLDRLSPADGAATLAAFTVEAVRRGAEHFPRPVLRWLVTGGGRRNPLLMELLRQRLSAPVDPVETFGWDGDALEAQAFAYLAVRSCKGLPLSLPSTTGVAAPMTGGRLHRRPCR